MLDFPVRCPDRSEHPARMLGEVCWLGGHPGGPGQQPSAGEAWKLAWSCRPPKPCSVGQARRRDAREEEACKGGEKARVGIPDID